MGAACVKSGSTDVVPSSSSKKDDRSHFRTRRLTNSSPIPDAAVQEMLAALDKLENISDWEQEIASLGIGRPPQFRRSFSSADELHNNFRMFCKYGRLDAVQFLTEGECRDFWCLHGSLKFNETGLVLAAKYGQYEVLPVLVAAGSELDYFANGGTALHWACKSFSQQNFATVESRQVAAVQHLLQEGAQMIVDGDKHDPLLLATMRGSVAMIKLLTAAGAQVTPQIEAESHSWGGAVVNALRQEERISVPYCAPDHWASRDEEAQPSKSEEDVQQVALFQHLMHETFKKVRTRDRRGLTPQALDLKRVVRNENPALWSRYLNARATLAKRRSEQCTPVPKLSASEEHPEVRTTEVLRSSIGKRLGENLVEAYLFHGTSKAGAEAICSEGFRRSMAGLSAGAAFGRGCYFAEASSKSDEYATPESQGECTMLLCRVVCGEMFRITKSDRLALSDALRSGQYDSVLADREASVGTYREFVVFDEECVYPEYVFTYKRVETNPQTK